MTDGPSRDDDLIRRVEDRARDLLASTVGGANGPNGGLEFESCGPYRVLEVLGEGGMGTVYSAEQTEPVRRVVALKVVKLGMDTKAVVSRFEHERQALALMQHDGIAQVYDCGTTDRGQPYFSMELVDGLPLDEFCDRHRMSLPARLGLIQDVCDAVQHAHQKGVVHRDLKPSNVLVRGSASHPSVKVIDFGLAKAMGPKLVEATMFTEAGQIVGTPEFMAPEQADPTNADIDTRADVYSIGVMLYELLVGELPFSHAELRKGGLLEVQRVLREVEPPKPSTRLDSVDGAASTEIATRRGTSVSSLRHALRNDLDWIVLKALEKDRERRYDTVDALAADIQRYLDHEPVLAGPPSVRYRLAKFGRKYRGQLAALAVLVASLAVGLAVSLHFWTESRALAIEKSGLVVETELRRKEAQTHLDRFNQLANVVHLDEARATVGTTFPPWPSNLAGISGWLRDHAEPLLAALPRLERARAEVEDRAVPMSEDERRAERENHPRRAELDLLERRLAGLERAMAVRSGAAEPPVVEPDAELDAMSCEELLRFASERIHPNFSQRTVEGEAGRALAAARLAVERASEERATFARTLLSWALFANGLDDDALAAGEQTLASAPASSAADARMGLDDLRQAIEEIDITLGLVRDEIARLEPEVSRRRSWQFERTEDEFLRNMLVELTRDVRQFEQDVVTRVRQRERWASRISELTLAHPNARVTWDDARAAIRAADGESASSGYRTDPPFELAPQCGLVPIGRNPATKLWEFYHLGSAWDPDGDLEPERLAIPQHEPDGSIRVEDGTGIVFVLVPGGEFWMGAQNADPTGPNFDEHAVDDEAPQRVALAPFFMARHELTQAQFVRLTGDENPSGRQPGQKWRGDPDPIGWTHPVEQVDWITADRLLTDIGLELPTEAQWEYACRAGSTTPWFTGERAGSLQGFANIADRTAKAVYAQWQCTMEVDDGWVSAAAPVGAFRPNAFGIHDTAGGVREWTRDPYSESYLRSEPRPGDGLRSKSRDGVRTIRGGDFARSAFNSRSAMRFSNSPEFRNNLIGMRAARAVRVGEF